MTARMRPDKNTVTAISNNLEKLAAHPGSRPVEFASVVKQLSTQWQLMHESSFAASLFIHDEQSHTLI